MKVNLWNTIHGARRRAIDRALLASMEREIANEERLRAKQAAAAETPEQRRQRIAAAFGRPL